MYNTNDKKNWYTLYTKFRHEKKVESQLQDMGIISYLPLRKVLKQWSDRRKWVEEPLFGCYIFIYADKRDRFYAVRPYGAVKLISFNDEPAIVQEGEIQKIKDILAEFPAANSYSVMTIGSQVEICRGQLAGMKGILEEVRNERRLVINIDSICRGIYFNVDIRDVKKIK